VDALAVGGDERRGTLR